MDAMFSSKSFQDCIRANQNYQASNASPEKYVRFIIQVFVRCSGAFLERHNGAITAVASLLIAAFTATLWHATRGMLTASAAQSVAMKQSIDQSARAATAMEDVARHFADNVATVKDRSAKQMRAYLSVLVHAGVYQERDKGFYFEGKPAMLNTGHTPAHKVRYQAGANILSVPIPSDFAFPLPEAPGGTASLGPQQNFIMSARVKTFCDDAEVFDIKRGVGKALYVWGIITYEDVFGDAHYTKFCQIITWLPDGKIWGYFATDYNEST
jgi:hypothetical protein